VFAFKKIVAFFLKPLTIFIILLLFSFFLLKKNNVKKANLFLIFSFFWLILISYGPISNAMLWSLESKYGMLKTIPTNVNYILVLGNGHTVDDTIPINSQVAPTALVRLSEGIRIHLKIKNSKLIVSGYRGNQSLSHALMQKKLALSLGVNAQNILLQQMPRDTQEEAQEIKKIVGNQKFVLVTSASHMPRAMQIFKAEGLDPIPAPTNFLSHEHSEYVSFPSGGHIKNFEVAAHEYIGIVWHIIVQYYNKLSK
jgi:uncharacterized SAM-binding protein YcdF (DUF218 family)